MDSLASNLIVSLQANPDRIFKTCAKDSILLYDKKNEVNDELDLLLCVNSTHKSSVTLRINTSEKPEFSIADNECQVVHQEEYAGAQKNKAYTQYFLKLLLHEELYIETPSLRFSIKVHETTTDNYAKVAIRAHREVNIVRLSIAQADESNHPEFSSRIESRELLTKQVG